LRHRIEVTIFHLSKESAIGALLKQKWPSLCHREPARINEQRIDYLMERIAPWPKPGQEERAIYALAIEALP
jgi:hypothetical protein